MRNKNNNMGILKLVNKPVDTSRSMSFFINNLFKLKENEKNIVFEQSKIDVNAFIVRLDGYALIPIEEYNELKKLKK